VNVALKISVVSEMLLYSDLLTLHNNTLNSTWHPSKTNSVNLTRCKNCANTHATARSDWLWANSEPASAY